MMLRIPQSLSAAILAVSLISLGGCAGFSADYGDMVFAKETPAMISTAWRQGNDVWIVPAKNCFVESANLNGVKLSLVIDGAYLKVLNAPSEFTLRIDGLDQRVVFSP